MTNIKAFEKKSAANQKRFRSFITKLENSEHKRGVLQQAKAASAEVWAETDCLSCANCCKKMTPTFTPADKRRISSHLGISTKAFETTYLAYDAKDKDWRMQQQPCVFLSQETNKCSIYAVRPADCSGFPHLTKAPLNSYLHIHKQNIQYCPATYLFVEKMMAGIAFENT